MSPPNRSCACRAADPGARVVDRPRTDPGHRNTSPNVARDPERRTLRERNQPAIGPKVGAVHAGADELTAQAELTAEFDRPRLASHERVGPGLELKAPDPDMRELAADPVGSLANRHVDAGVHEPIRRRQPGDAAADDHDASGAAHPAGTSDRCSRTTVARTSRYAGSAFGMRVRSNRSPASSASCRASMSRSYRISR